MFWVEKCWVGVFFFFLYARLHTIQNTLYRIPPAISQSNKMDDLLYFLNKHYNQHFQWLVRWKETKGTQKGVLLLSKVC